MPASSNLHFLRILKYGTLLKTFVRGLYRRPAVGLEKQLMGLTFIHPIGVAAGTDKRGEFSDAIYSFHPAFLEIGPLRDVRFAIKNLQNRKTDIIIFGNLSTSTDLVSAFTLIYDFVDAIVLNVSHGSSVSRVIDHLLELRRYNDTYKPIIFKLFADLNQDEADEVAAYMLGSGIDGIMVQAEFVERYREKTQGLLPIIAVGEISAPERASQILASGADLIAVTNSPAHYGPGLIQKIVKSLQDK